MTGAIPQPHAPDAAVGRVLVVVEDPLRMAGGELHVCHPSAGDRFIEHELAGGGVVDAQVGVELLLLYPAVDGDAEVAGADQIVIPDAGIGGGHAEARTIVGDMREGGHLARGDLGERTRMAGEIGNADLASLDVVDGAGGGMQANAGLAEASVAVAVEVDIGLQVALVCCR